MTKNEFMMEAALRLIVAKPQEDMSRIADMAEELTERIMQKTSSNLKFYDSADDVVNSAPVNDVVVHIERQGRCSGYGVKLDRVFRANNIQTVGDLLHIGSRALRSYRNVGAGSLSRISDALYELYKINEW